jgi:putative peptidoglycan lipid II flippase
LYTSAFYALNDTRSPLNFAAIRVLLTVGLGYLAAVRMPGWLDVAPRWGAVGLTASAGVAGWVEFAMLRRSLHRRIGTARIPLGFLVRIWGSALLAGGIGVLILSLVVDRYGPIPRAVLVLTPFGIIYLASTAFLDVPQARGLMDRFLRRA